MSTLRMSANINISSLNVCLFMQPVPFWSVPNQNQSNWWIEIHAHINASRTQSCYITHNETGINDLALILVMLMLDVLVKFLDRECFRSSVKLGFITSWTACAAVTVLLVSSVNGERLLVFLVLIPLDSQGMYDIHLHYLIKHQCLI